ncbi:MAG: hypothetical protein IKG61_02255, partial [Selenomonadaceae bacterium]|nr:hypothetical protein [Selenomonadaceae bacterium]
NLYYPRVTVAKFIYKNKFNYSKLKISNKDFDKYSLPIDVVDDKYLHNKINGFTKVTPLKFNSELSHAWFAEFPLSEITADNVQEKIFGTFDKLAELKS